MKRLLGLLIACAAAGAFAAAAPSDLQQQLDLLVRQGYDQPEPALAAIDALQAQLRDDAGAQRSLWLARGLIEARDGRETAALTSAQHLRTLAQRSGDVLARADAELVLATLDEIGGRSSADHAQAASADYEQQCGNEAAPPRTDCDHRSRWSAQRLLGTRAVAEGNTVRARTQFRASLEIARNARDPYREAWSLASLAGTHALAGEFDPALKLLAQAQRLAGAEGSEEIVARVKLSEAKILALRGDAVQSMHASEEGLRHARAARSPRLAALFLASLSDDYAKQGRPQDALKAVEQALPVMRRHHDQRNERILLHNAALARLGLGQITGAKKDMEQMLTLWQNSGSGDEAQALREFGDALAAAGDLRGALELYHRERKLTDDMMARNREAALKELQARYDREAKQRNIELLERDNTLKTAQIENRALLQRIWTLVAATLALAVLFAVLLYLRVRETQRQLVQSQARLRVQSERDALTGLANRRHFQDVMLARGGQRAFEGSLLLVDIDHFKHVNDRHGHAAGDEVLVEVAHRLAQAVREDDLVVRWGGEEFLVFAPALKADALEAFAERLLHGIGGTAIDTASGALRVTASIGHAHFPLAPHQVQLSWERALNLADMALYTAKSLGRNRAIGIEAVQAQDAESLAAMEADFERAWTEGHVTLRTIEGPEAAPA